MTAWVLRPGPSASQASAERFPYLNASRREGRIFAGAAVVAVLVHIVAVWVPLPERVAAPPPEPVEEPTWLSETPLPPPPEPEPVAVPERVAEPPRDPLPVPEPPDFIEPLVEQPVAVPDEPVSVDTDLFEMESPVEPVEPAPEVPELVDETHAGLTMPVVIDRPSPTYPPAAISVRLQAEVILEAVVAADGSVADVRLVSVTGGPDLGFSESAIDAVSRWRYRPGSIDGRPVAVRMKVYVSFHLR